MLSAGTWFLRETKWRQSHNTDNPTALCFWRGVFNPTKLAILRQGGQARLIMSSSVNEPVGGLDRVIRVGQIEVGELHPVSVELPR